MQMNLRRVDRQAGRSSTCAGGMRALIMRDLLLLLLGHGTGAVLHLLLSLLALYVRALSCETGNPIRAQLSEPGNPNNKSASLYIEYIQYTIYPNCFRYAWSPLVLRTLSMAIPG